MTLLCFLAFATLQLCHAQSLKAHALFAHHVVLQTTDDNGPGTCLSGSGVAGETVTLKANMSAVASAKVNKGGEWLMDVNMASGGPFTMELSGSQSGNTITIQDALIGDVYVCSGQSNM